MFIVNFSHLFNFLSDSSFWNFSFVDLGRYDAPAMIYHIINVTNYGKLIFRQQIIVIVNLSIFYRYK